MFSVAEFMNLHIQTLCVITECSIVRYSKSCLFLLHCTVFEYDKLRTWCLIKHALSTLSVHY